MKKILSSLLLATSALCAFPAPLDEARQLVKEGDFWKARQLLDEAIKKTPRLSNSAEYNYLLGACEFDSGKYDNARKLLQTALDKRYWPACLYLGRLSFLDYNFEEAQSYYAKYREHREKTGQVAGETVEELERQVMLAENSLSRVEKIEVIDSITVPFENFYKAYKLPRSAGRLICPEEMPIEDHRQGAVVAFINEGDDYMMWGEPDSIGNVRLMESLRLTDGTWQTPKPVSAKLSEGGYADYPFMMPDGITLYYSCDSPDSMGGYDIFVAVRDAATGEYLQPQNIGMPFNSPYDDLMLAIDEVNGVGWWATNRNRIDDKITIYVYKVNEARVNYSREDESILPMARLTDYRATQNPANKAQYDDLLSRIAEIDTDIPEKEVDFKFPVGGGKYYHNMSDFKSTGAIAAMNSYIKCKKNLKSLEEKLTELRKRYPVNRADNVKEEIIRLESQVENKRIELTHLRSNVYRCMKGEQ